MRYKRFTVGLISLIVGIILIIIAIDAFHKISAAQGVTEDIKNFFTHNPTWNPIITFFGGEAEQKVASYHTSATLALILGIILTVVGGATAIVYRGRKN